jgi:1-acyl-sn-glycerol-3-phosphate acyltransferase
LKPPLRVYGVENVPLSGPCLITFNHYFRPHFHAWWLALAVAAVVPVEMHWVMTGELTFPGKWYAFLGKPISRWVLRRLAKIYGFTTMPPMPPRPKDVEARARSVRGVLEYLRAHPAAILGLSPEGGDDPNGRLAWPAPGAGRFLLLLAGTGFPILPVGMYEQAGEFCLRFGAAYRLRASSRASSRAIPPRLGPDERDRRVAEIIMTNIARQLPQRLRGEFDISSNGSF